MVAPGDRRAAALLAILLLAVLLVLARPVHDWLLSVFAAAEDVVRSRPLLGIVVFVLLTAVSAMIAFVSSAALVPVAVYVWGPGVCFLLLWTGWFLGGLAGYAIGRYLGRPVVARLVQPDVLLRYERWAHSGRSLVPILLAQLAVPTDLAGYVFGLVRCRAIVFIAALALAEIPYALGAVYLGKSFLEGRVAAILLIGAAAALGSWWALRHLRIIHRSELAPGSAGQ